MSSYSDYSHAAAEIIQHQGDIAADAARRKGAMWGGAVQTLGQIPGAFMAQRQHEREFQARQQNQQQESQLKQQEIDLRKAALMQKEDPREGQLKDLKLREARVNAARSYFDSVDESTYPDVVPELRRIFGPGSEAEFPDQYPGDAWAERHKKEGTITAESLAAERKAIADAAKEAAKPKPLHPVETVDAEGKTVTKMVDPTVAAEYPKPTGAATGRNPTEWSLIDAAAKGDKSAIAALALYRRQHPTSGGGAGGDSGALTTGDKQLVAAILKNPRIYAGLTPTVKTKLAAELSAQGFSGFEDGSAGKPPTGAQNKVLGFFNRAKQADEDLETVEADVAKMGYLEQKRMKSAPNFAQTQTGQSYNQAQRAFTEARLRKDSGAAIPDSEFENDRRTYFAQPGDSAATLAQKNRARKAVLATLAFEAGPALSGFYGEDANSLIEDYRSKAKKPAETAPKKIGRFTVEVEP